MTAAVLSLLFTLSTLPFSSNAAAQSVLPNPDLFTPFEKEIDNIAQSLGGNNDAILMRLKQMGLGIKNADDIAALNAFKCELFRIQKAPDRLAEVIHVLDENILAKNDNYALRAARELCQMYRETKQEDQISHVAMAYYYARFSSSASLRFIVSTMYIDFTAAQGRAQDSLAAAQAALAIAQANKDIFRQSIALYSLATIELDYGDKQAALDYIDQAIVFAKEFPQRYSELFYQYTRVAILIEMKRLLEAHVAHDKVNEFARELRKNLPKTLWSPDFQMFELANNMELAYLEGNYQASKKYAEALERIATEHQSQILIASAQMTYALASIKLGDYSALESHFNQALQILITKKRSSEVRDGYEKLAEAMASMGKYKEAFAATQEKDQLISQMAKENRGDRSLELRETLKASQREKENLELKALNHKQLIEVESATLRLERWWLFAALLALGLAWVGHANWMARRRNATLHDLNQELDQQRLQDVLTGLGNRRYLMQHQTAIQTRTAEQAKSGRCSAILLIDADHFKRINDEHGHAAGDLALIEIANVLKHCIKENDLCVRWGGEEFLIYAEINNAASAAQFAQKIIQTMRQHQFAYEQKRIQLSVSIGYILLPLQGYPEHSHASTTIKPEFRLDDSFKLVDAALYLAKRRGRHRAIGIGQIHANCRNLTLLASELEEAWNLGEVEISEIIETQGN